MIISVNKNERKTLLTLWARWLAWVLRLAWVFPVTVEIMAVRWVLHHRVTVQNNINYLCSSKMCSFFFFFLWLWSQINIEWAYYKLTFFLAVSAPAPGRQVCVEYFGCCRLQQTMSV